MPAELDKDKDAFLVAMRATKWLVKGSPIWLSRREKRGPRGSPYKHRKTPHGLLNTQTHRSRYNMQYTDPTRSLRPYLVAPLKQEQCLKQWN